MERGEHGLLLEGQGRKEEQRMDECGKKMTSIKIRLCI